MPFEGFEGPAGTGKTRHLTDAILHRVAVEPLATHQRVLALTFMHGSRRRLEAQFSALAGLRGRHTCMTIDSFAGHVVERWRSLATPHNAHAGNFNQTCDACGRLLEETQIAKWVAATFPVLAVDEAQELSPPRLRIIRALAPHVKLYVAADEFQCLDEDIDTAPFMTWFRTGRITSLTRFWRTSQKGLLGAAAALRASLPPPQTGPGFDIRYEFPNQMPLAIGHALHRGRTAGGTTALLVAPGSRSWADTMLARLTQGMQTPKQTVLPLRIAWETQPDTEIDLAMAAFSDLQDIPVPEIKARLSRTDELPLWIPLVAKAITHQLRVKAQLTWTATALRQLMERKAALQRAYGYNSPGGIPVITIRSAKNRQFGHVVVLWGPGVQADHEQQARLLYNAITRAETRCTVFVRTDRLLQSPPFA
jgi:hypothetical protein